MADITRMKDMDENKDEERKFVEPWDMSDIYFNAAGFLITIFLGGLLFWCFTLSSGDPIFPCIGFATSLGSLLVGLTVCVIVEQSSVDKRDKNFNRFGIAVICSAANFFFSYILEVVGYTLLMWICFAIAACSWLFGLIVLRIISRSDEEPQHTRFEVPRNDDSDTHKTDLSTSIKG